jgi:hypothetical protein
MKILFYQMKKCSVDLSYQQYWWNCIKKLNIKKNIRIMKWSGSLRRVKKMDKFECRIDQNFR